MTKTSGKKRTDFWTKKDKISYRKSKHKGTWYLGNASGIKVFKKKNCEECS
jgi:hypothetical protein